MEEAIQAIVDRLRGGAPADGKWLDRLLRDCNRAAHDATRSISKRRLLPFYLHERDCDSAVYRSWGIDDAIHDAIVSLLRAKPRRTASGVATVTVLTKPWPCAGDCVYCPSDVRMPKSYLSDEPACQRAERCWFDPYLQVAARMRVLADMGHNTDKVELIVLGGTWSEYPQDYRLWFVGQMFRCLNSIDDASHEAEVARRRTAYEAASGCGEGRDSVCAMQRRVNVGELTYNEAVAQLAYPYDALFSAEGRLCDEDFLEREQQRNEDAAHRNVGLVVETRPDLVTDAHLEHLRRLGCTKIQIGVQSLDQEILSRNARRSSLSDIERAFSLLRAHGFKSHVHLMTNLIGASAASDKATYDLLVSDGRFKPDEVKLYPCALVESARLTEAYETGSWRPYTEDELLDVLSHDVEATPPYTRISRMIRDISSKDILAGNKKTNLRQLVEQRACAGEGEIQEMRIREIGTEEATAEDVGLSVVEYATSNTAELFLQYATSDDRLVAFLRLSLPDECEHAMIREVHVYGRVSRLHETKEGAQHTGLGRSLVERACELARERGRLRIGVISAVGTRAYYRSLGFCDGDLYQWRGL